MDSNSKKREVQHVNCDDMINHQVKRMKSKNADYTLLFMEVLSNLSDKQKTYVKKLGFGSLLDFSCSSNINNIFAWLMDYVDTDSGTLNFENGFKYTLSANIVQKILGLPFGSKPVILNSTDSSTEFIVKAVKHQKPSVQYLCSLITHDLNEESFSIIFMLLVLSSFVAPDGNGLTSPLLYNSLINIADIPSFDWCTLALNWLLMHIKKYKTGSSTDITKIGGCKIMLVISYFEFLITSEFILGISVPRIPLWTTHVVNSYIALDSIHGSKKMFGRLSRKHISSTPFKGVAQIFPLQLPEEIHQYINQKFKDLDCKQKNTVQALTQNFFQQMVNNCIPTLKCYIDDVTQSNRSSDHGTDSIIQCQEKVKEVDKNKGLMTGVDKFSYIQKEFEGLLDRLWSTKKLNDDLEPLDTRNILQGLAAKFSENCIVDDAAITLPNRTEEYERSLHPPLQDLSAIISQIGQRTDCIEYIKQELQELQEVEWLTRSTNLRTMDTKFSLSTMDFLLPGQKYQAGIDSEFSTSLIFKKTQQNADNLFMFSNQRTKDVEDKKPVKWGMSLNERVLGRRIPANNRNIGFVSFDLIDEEDFTNNGDPQGQITDSVLDGVEPMITNVKHETIGNKSTHSTIKQNSEGFLPSSSIRLEELPPQVIFASQFEHEFYNTLMETKNESTPRPRICELENVWVDQRTLSLSMSPGGWIHPYVMDYFGILSNMAQYHREKEGAVTKKDILMHIVIKEDAKLLLDPKFNPSDPKHKDFWRYASVGFRLENAGLVHIPCPYERQWILITANFIDKSFDVLNPDLSNDKFQPMIKTVTSNFKNLFVLSYPRCTYFKIHDFKIRYIEVPKANFRYDTGIFVMQYIRCFNGIEVKQFSNIDVLPMREKFCCQLVLNKYNEHQIPLVQKFLATHAPHLLRPVF